MTTDAMLRQSIPDTRQAVLIETGPGQGEFRLERGDLTEYAGRVGARLDAARKDNSQRVVACFTLSWQFMAAAQAALCRGLDFQPWHLCGLRSRRRQLRQCCNKLGAGTAGSVLLVDEKLVKAFAPADLEKFQAVVPLDLAGEAAQPAARRQPQPQQLQPQACLIVETQATWAGSRAVALPVSALQYRIGLAEQTDDDGPWLEVMPIDTARGMEHILGCCRDTVVMNPDLAAENPMQILDVAGRYGATGLYLTPGHLSRLLRHLDKAPPHTGLEALRTIIVGGAGIMPRDLVAFADRLQAAGATDLHVQMEYRTTECGLVTSTARLRAQDLRDIVALGAHVSLGSGIGNTEIRTIDGDLKPLQAGGIGQIQIRRSDGIASHYIGREGKPSRLRRKSGWVDSGDVGFIDRSGLTITSHVNARLVSSQGYFEVPDIESRLRQVAGQRPELLAVVPFNQQQPYAEKVAVCFSAIDQSEAGLKRIASGLSGTVSAMTGLKPALYHCQREDVPLTASLTVKHLRLRQMIRSGTLPAIVEQPAAIAELPEAIAGPFADEERTDLPPLSELQVRATQICQDTLQLETPPRLDDDVMELGADSLALMTMLTEMERAFKRKVDIEAFFADPTIEGICASLGDAESGEPAPADGEQPVASDAAEGAGRIPPNRIPAGCDAITPEMLPLVRLTAGDIGHIVDAVPGGAANIQDIYPLTPTQEGILFHYRMAAEGDPYLKVGIIAFDSRDYLDRYLDALQAVIDRHDILRTSMLWEGLPEPVQIVWRKAPIEVREITIDAAAGDVTQQLRDRFDRRHYRVDLRQAPQMHVFIAPDPENGRWLAMQDYHEASFDASTILIVQEEVQAYLSNQADRLSLPMPYRDFVAQVRSSDFEEYHEAFFRRMLADVSEPTMPFGLADVYRDGSDFAEARQSVDKSLARRLQAGARTSRASVASIFHLAWALVLARISGRDDVVFGTVLSGRMRSGSGSTPAPGPFLNMLPFRISVGDAGVLDSLRHTHSLLSQLVAHEHASLAVAQRCSALVAPAPLFSSILNYRQDAAVKAHSPIEGLHWLSFEERTNYPLSLSVDHLGEDFRLIVQVVAGIDPQRVFTYMHAALEQVANALENEPGMPLASLDVMPADERHQLLVEWNETSTDYPREQSVHRLFEAQAGRTPDAIALVCGDSEMSYRELNARANRLAHHLISLGVGPGTLVGICHERSPELIVGLLGILKAGGAYVPLDPNYPPARLAFMLTASKAPVLITEETLLRRLPAFARHILCLDRDRDVIAGGTASNPSKRVRADDLAYVIFTSGSSGEPKGVEVEHRSVVNFLSAMQSAPGLAKDDVLLAVTTLSFDIAALEIFAPLVTGARLVIASRDDAMDGRALLELIDRHAVTILQATPVTWQTLIDAGWQGSPKLKALCGGEELSVELAGKIVKRCKALWNMYGPTETTIWSSTAPIPEPGDFVPLGRPIANTTIYMLDAAGRPAPIDVAGELTIGGVGVARGYLKRPDLTAEKFMPDPFSGKAGARAYRTGDLARYRPDGSIEFLGRLDDQVKIRGFRIELGEIEARLGEVEAIAQSAVIVREDTPGNRQIVAYVVPRADTELDHGALRARLKEHLPAFMIPATFVSVEHLPLTPNGKIDRRALPRPEITSGLGEAPVGHIETKLAGIWAEMLKLDKVGRHDNFFELGGHSLLAMQVVSRACDAFGLQIPPKLFFEEPTVKGFGDYVAMFELMRQERGEQPGGSEITRVRI